MKYLDFFHFKEEFPYFFSLQCLGKKLNFYTEQQKTIDFLCEIFYPDGVLSASLCFDKAGADSADIHVYEKIIDTELFKEVVSGIKEQGVVKGYSPAGGMQKPSYLLGGLEVFVFSDGENPETLVVKKKECIFLLSDEFSDFIRKSPRIIREILSRWRSISMIDKNVA